MNRIALLAFAMTLPLGLRAQDPALAVEDLDFTRSVVAGNHLIALVEMRVDEDQYVRFRYDGYPDLRRIVTEDGLAYTQPKGGPWVKSNDWGKTGSAVEPTKARELDTFASVAESPLAPSVSQDCSQGQAVWKLVGQAARAGHELFTYERSRERPRPDGVYPRYTFLKYPDDPDGQLLLEHFSAQLRSGGKLIPVEIQFDFMFQLPAGSVIIEEVPRKTESNPDEPPKA